ncbi:D-alanine--D-alanine ligase family protein [Enterococcus cecorum]|uniref:D-alanine--D-alanine ligase family protein n=1 Tax=Enterococcus cecorum TaxID=44008 RepID=UPI00148B887D|nr:ATP-grasp domain-containing protein [Enterococcus cecorum]
MIDINLLVVYGGNTIESNYSVKAYEYISSKLKKKFKNVYGLNILDIVENLHEKKLNTILKNTDVAISVVYGLPGQEGEIQGIFDLYGINYIGSGVLACSVIKDKKFFKDFCKINSINVPKDLSLSKDKLNEGLLDNLKKITYPVVVKPRKKGGLSLGISYCVSEDELLDAIEKAFAYDENVIVEEYINGIEITACVFNDKVLPLIEIEKQNKILDYHTKINGIRKNIIPANIDNYLYKKIENQVMKIFKYLNMKDWGYFDIMIKDNQIYFIEAGAVPGMTASSSIPILLNYLNIDIGNVLQEIILKNMK